MRMQDERPSRPRRYDFLPPSVATSSATAAVQFLAALDELQERVLDQISDLPQEAVDFLPQGASNSIGMLVVHMAWAEASWISRVVRTPVPPALLERLSLGQQDASGALAFSSHTVAGLTELCRDVRIQMTGPALRVLHDVDTQVPAQQTLMTARGVLMHLVWHWTYHSGQIGLLRRQWGARYKWTFGDKMGVPRPPKVET